MQPAHLGIDWDGPLPFTGDNVVDVDPPEQPLNDADYDELCTRINPLEQSAEYGVDLYSETLQYVLCKIIASNSN